MEAELKVKKQVGSITKVLGEKGLAPFFRARRITRRWFGLLPPELEPVTQTTRSSARLPLPEFEQITAEALLGEAQIDDELLR